MSFASPGWLALWLAGLPILLLHVFVRRPQRRTVSSLFLWRRVSSRVDERRPSLKSPLFNLPLWLQLMFVFLTGLALSNPSLGEGTAYGNHLILVIDNSGSMAATDVAPSRLEAARAGARASARDFHEKGGGRISVVATSIQPHVLGARLSPEEAERVLDRLEETYGASAWGEVAELVRGLLLPGETWTLHLFTDGAGDPDPRSVLAAALSGGTIVPFYVGTPSASNRSLDHVRVTLIEGPPRRWRVEGRVRAFPAQQGTVPVRIWFQPAGAPGAGEWAVYQIELDGGTATFQYELALPGEGVLEIRLPDDLLSYDNRAFFVLREPDEFTVLYVGSGNPALLRAFQAIAGVEVQSAPQLPGDAHRYDLVVVDGVSVARHPATSTLWIGVPPAPARRPAGELLDALPTGWKAGHPLSYSVDWASLVVDRAIDVDVLPGAEVLLEASGRPLIQARTTAFGREVVLAFPVETGGWHKSLSFPAFVDNLVHWIRPGLGSPVQRPGRVGERYPLDAAAIAAGARLVDPAGNVETLPRFVVEEGDDGTGAHPPPSWWLPGAEPAFWPRRAGLYTLETADGRAFIAVNAFGGDEADLRAAESAVAGPDGDGGAVRGPRPLWRLLTGLGLFVLLWEGWLFGRDVLRLRHRRGETVAPGGWTRRTRAAAAAHALAVFLLGLAAADAPRFSRIGERVVVLVADETLAPGGAAGVSRIMASLSEQAGRHWSAGLVWLGPYARVGADRGGELPSESAVRAHSEPAVNLEQGLEVAAALVPSATPARILLVSDGTETRGEVGRVLPHLVRRGIPVDVMPVRGIPAGEVFVENLFVPRRVHAADPFRLTGIVYSDGRITSTLRIYRSRQLWIEQDVELLPGRNRIEAVSIEDEPGSYLYEVEVEAAGDTIRENNRAGGFVEVGKPASAVIFAPKPDRGRLLAQALSLQGIDADVLPPERAPWNADAWRAYDVVILLNVPAIKLHTSQQAMLAEAVRRGGTGLIVIGGPNAYGPGGYYQTVLEQTLPLSSRVAREMPSIALLFVLDKSGSMQQREAGVPRLEIARRAILDAVPLLSAESLVGVVAFDSETFVAAPIQPAADLSRLSERLASLEPGGGTSLYPALVAAYETLLPIDSMARHIVVLSDGLSQPGDFDGIIARIVEAGMTLSTVAIGRGADTFRLRQLAALAGGVSHVTEDWQALPSILAQEALLQSNIPVDEGAFVPVPAGDVQAAFLRGASDSWPPLLGHVLTTAKPEADVHLVGPGDAPLLASWRYGAGRVVAFTSDASGPWSVHWVEEEAYPRFWAQVVRWVLPPVARGELDARAERDGDFARLIVLASSPEALGEGGPELAADIGHPGEGGIRRVRMQPDSPVAYSAIFPVSRPGTFEVSVRATGESARVEQVGAEVRFHVSYPARFQFDRSGGDRLRAIANLTGGRVLFGDEPLFVREEGRGWTRRPGWPLWTALGFAAFFVGLPIRYLGSWRTLRGM